MKMFLVISGFLIWGAVPAQADVGQRAILSKLSEVHGDYRVVGQMVDGTECTVGISSTTTSFKVDLFNKFGTVSVYSVVLHPYMRLISLDLRDNPDKRTNLSVRDRVRTDKISTDVDARIYIEESADGKIVVVQVDDAIKRRRLTCRGAKLVMKAPKPVRPGPAARPPARSPSFEDGYH